LREITALGLERACFKAGATLELVLIEGGFHAYTWKSTFLTSREDPTRHVYDVISIGAGTAGFAAARTLASAGFSVSLVRQDDLPA
jgi:NADPH-dependent 2,4-dienoyl-CoA reductase/sulfur reductase-like enzyme